MSNRSAVFGGAGFIGTNLVYQLIEDGQQVFNFDNLSGLGNLLNIAELMQQSRHSFARCDISNPEEIRQALLMAAADTIFSASLRRTRRKNPVWTTSAHSSKRLKNGATA